MILNQQGVRPGSINMGRVLRHLRYRSEQSRLVTYYRPPIYNKDNYGIETTVENTPEILIPKLSALIRPSMTADYQLQKSGHNIVGAARVYTPNIQTIKNPILDNGDVNVNNFDQTVGKSNIVFNEIEGWDRFIDIGRYIYQVPTSATTGWASGSADATFSTDGQTLTATLGTAYSGTFNYPTTATNTLEADRFQFDIKASGASTMELINFATYNGGTTTQSLTYTPAAITIPTGSWLTIDVPFASGSIASGTTLYKDGDRYAVTMASGASFNDESDFRKFEFKVDGKVSGNKIYIKGLRYYKSISWHVHSAKELNRDYMIFNCVRVTGARDSRRRAYN
jgi:hypothetical protein|tara:strand:+ start:417 stop:1433 length:1017 start_codon:yes stop_codon:yes gene_type:complete